MPFTQPSDPYVNPFVEYDPRDSFVTVGECAEILGVSRDQVIELAERGTLRTCGGLVQPAAIPGYTM